VSARVEEATAPARPVRTPPAGGWWHRWRAQQPTVTSGAILVIVLILLTLTAPVVARYDPTTMDVTAPLRGPSPSHLFGTDNFGRDIFSRVVFGSRAVLIMAAASTGLAVVVGAVLGLLLAYRRGWVDEVGMRLIDILMSIPPLVLALLLISALGNDSLLVVLTVAFLFAPRVARIVRSAALAIVTEDYVTAALTRGESAFGIALRELLPNVVGTVFVEFSIRCGYAIVFIGALGFLGFGAPPPAPEWGLMINEGYSNINASFWPVLAPAGTMAVLVIALNLFTEGVARVIGQTGMRGARE
jgi:peptide/nickel transport system permease protein